MTNFADQPEVAAAHAYNAAPTLAGGPPGLEGIHTFVPSVPGLPGVAMNDMWTTSGGRKLPGTSGMGVGGSAVRVPFVYRLNKIGGLTSAPDADDNREPLTARIGEAAYPSLTRGRTLTYEGTCVGGTLDSLREGIARLRAAASYPAEGALWLTYNTGRSSTIYYASARPTQFEAGDEQTIGRDSARRFSRDFVFALRMADPRFYLWNSGADSPWFSFGTYAEGTHTIDVTMTAPTQPTFDLYEPSGVVVINWPSGGNLAMNVSGMSGETMRVNYGQRRIWNVDTGADMMGTLSVPFTDAWDLGKGMIWPGSTAITVDNVTNWGVALAAAYW